MSPRTFSVASTLGTSALKALSEISSWLWAGAVLWEPSWLSLSCCASFEVNFFNVFMAEDGRGINASVWCWIALSHRTRGERSECMTHTRLMYASTCTYMYVLQYQISYMYYHVSISRPRGVPWITFCRIPTKVLHASLANRNATFVQPRLSNPHNSDSNIHPFSMLAVVIVVYNHASDSCSSGCNTEQCKLSLPP